jgi:5-bromo-4-chloroindolyl phosphate hydrolysis protein
MEIEILLDTERSKCINVLKEYNTKYDTEEQKKLENTLEYLNSLLKTCTDEYKKILIEDINNINSYLFSKHK